MMAVMTVCERGLELGVGRDKTASVGPSDIYLLPLRWLAPAAADVTTAVAFFAPTGVTRWRGRQSR